MSELDSLRLFIKISQHRMYSHYLPKLFKAIEQLDINTLWHKETSISNSIGGIVLHICEHIKRNSIRFSNQNQPGFTKGIEDYFPNIKISPNELIKVSNDTFGDFNEVMQRVLNNPLEKIDMHSLYHLVEHTGYHLGQIIDRTQRITETSLQFCQNGINERNLKAIIEGN